MCLHDWTKISPCVRNSTPHRVNLYTPRYCQSATFGPLAFCVCSLLFYGKKILMSPRPPRPPRAQLCGKIHAEL